ncbi:hypothetical protein [Swingsia samuiensis]|uniref:Uncharacterized protein n=1 Tax=Swingsia samuiensis TaxID=1293412 RepID=A0A4Y6UIJ9_9PROT|nr:hypothetical protein [Swingsia samuiensis]QDH17372.1 hypothetical protein E3D00_07210 [Swingsia samuiensis]
MKNIVIFKEPREKYLLVVPVGILLFIICIFFEYVFVIKELWKFNGVNQLIKIDDDLFKGLVAGWVLIGVIFSRFVAMIRNNKKSQRIEAVILFSSLLSIPVAILFSHPLLLLWGHFHHYSLDHYEAAHRGGWYFFKLDGD